jgi:FixJ family two-component response regulator
MSDMSIDRVTYLLNANREAGRKLRERQEHDKAKAEEARRGPIKLAALECKPTRPSAIAVIDDDPEILEALDIVLSSCGYRPELFASAEEFLNVAATSNAACLVTDIQLGGISGVELGRQLSAKGFTFPITLITGSPDELHRQQAIDLDCVAFLPKPFPSDRLIEAITSAIGSQHLGQ